MQISAAAVLLRGRVATLFTAILASLVSCAPPASASGLDPISICPSEPIVRPSKLTADLTCPKIFLAGTRLSMNGHTLSGEILVLEKTSARITGPGTITGPGSGVDAVGSVRIFGVDLIGNDERGVNAENQYPLIGRSRVRITDSIVQGNGFGSNQFVKGGVFGYTVKAKRVQVLNNNGPAITSIGRLLVRSSHIEGNTEGVFGVENVRITRSRILNNAGSGVDIGYNNNIPGRERNREVRVTGSEVSDNGGTGIFGGTHLRVRDCIVERNGADGLGVFGPDPFISGPETAFVTTSVVRFNGRSGVGGEKVVLNGSFVEHNGTAPECGVTAPCADLISDTEPIVPGNSGCGTSIELFTGVPGTSWGACSLDP